MRWIFTKKQLFLFHILIFLIQCHLLFDIDALSANFDTWSKLELSIFLPVHGDLCNCLMAPRTPIEYQLWGWGCPKHIYISLGGEP